MTHGYSRVRKISEGEVTCDLFGLLTTDGSAEVGAVHSKAMPGICQLSPAFRSLGLKSRAVR